MSRCTFITHMWCGPAFAKPIVHRGLEEFLHTRCVVASSGSGSNRSGLRPRRSSHALKASVKLMTAGLCSCGSTLSVGLLDVPPFALFLPHSRPECSRSFSVHFISYHFICSHHSVFGSVAASVITCIGPYSRGTRGPILAKINSPRSHFTAGALISCKRKLKNNVCSAALLLGFHKYGGQIVFVRHRERYYPSSRMSSVIGIIAAKLQKWTLRVRALQVGRSDDIRERVLSAHVWPKLSLRPSAVRARFGKEEQIKSTDNTPVRLWLALCPGQTSISLCSL